MKRETVFSPDRLYRYTLWREWAKWKDDLFNAETHERKRVKDGYCMFIALNPSTADETKDDPTIRRCIRFAKDWGYGALCMTNLFAFRATDPKLMKAVNNPLGDDNPKWVCQCAESAGIVVAAWGRDGAFHDAGRIFSHLLKSKNVALHHLGLNSDGTPKHPLYLKADTKPQLFV